MTAGFWETAEAIILLLVEFALRDGGFYHDKLGPTQQQLQQVRDDATGNEKVACKLYAQDKLVLEHFRGGGTAKAETTATQYRNPNAAFLQSMAA